MKLPLPSKEVEKKVLQLEIQRSKKVYQKKLNLWKLMKIFPKTPPQKVKVFPRNKLKNDDGVYLKLLERSHLIRCLRHPYKKVKDQGGKSKYLKSMLKVKIWIQVVQKKRKK